MKTEKSFAKEILGLVVETGLVYLYWSSQSTYTISYTLYKFLEGYPLVAYVTCQTCYVMFSGMFPAFIFLIASRRKFWLGKF